METQAEVKSLIILHAQVVGKWEKLNSPQNSYNDYFKFDKTQAINIVLQINRTKTTARDFSIDDY